MECVGLVDCLVTVFCGLGVASYPQPLLVKAQVYCPGPTRVIPLPTQGGGGTRAPTLTHVVAFGGVVVHVFVPERGGFVV